MSERSKTMVLQCEALLKGYQRVTLTEAQRDALGELLRWYETGAHGVLEGFAGTGKTTLLLALIVELGIRGEEERLFVTAPTHKAAKVLNSKIQSFCAAAGVPVPVEATTIHSLLGLKPKRSRPGEPEGFVASGRCGLSANAYLILDECSMVGRELYEYVMSYARQYGTTVLFSGDPKQLRPVNETQASRSFDLGNKVQLTEVVRHGGPVLQLATQIRQMHRFALPVIKDASDGDSRVVAHPSMGGLFDQWLDRLEQLHERKDLETDKCVMVCWTNKHRRFANKQARIHLHGPDVPDFMPGDRLVMIRPYTVDDTVVLANNADIVLTSAERTQLRPVESLPNTYECWELTAENVANTIYVLTDEERNRHAKDVKELGKEISAAIEAAKSAHAATEKTLRQEGYTGSHLGLNPSLIEASNRLRDAKERWSEYFALKERFADVDFGYALTVHKSQGSTYEAVYVHEDMLQSKDERPQLLYVAVTRASKEVHHLALPTVA